MMRQLLPTALLLTVGLCGTSRPAQAAPASPAQVSTARARYATINRELKTYRKVERDLMGLSLEGGSLTAYYQGTQPRKIVGRFYGESGQNIEEYYFWKGQLFFFYKVEKAYDSILSGKVVRQYETRAYFENGKLVKLLTDKTPQSLTTPAAKQITQDATKSVRFYLDAASKPNTREERKMP